MKRLTESNKGEQVEKNCRKILKKQRPKTKHPTKPTQKKAPTTPKPKKKKKKPRNKNKPKTQKNRKKTTTPT